MAGWKKILTDAMVADVTFGGAVTIGGNFQSDGIWTVYSTDGTHSGYVGDGANLLGGNKDDLAIRAIDDFFVSTDNSTTPSITVSGTDTTFAGDISIPAADKLYLDGGTHTYITESPFDTISFAAGLGGTALTLTALQATFNGSVRCGVNFQSSDGTSGANDVISWEDADKQDHTVTIKDGLITSWTVQ
jgi:hypothetical protein